MARRDHRDTERTPIASPERRERSVRPVVRHPAWRPYKTAAPRLRDAALRQENLTDDLIIRGVVTKAIFEPGFEGGGSAKPVQFDSLRQEKPSPHRRQMGRMVRAGQQRVDDRLVSRRTARVPKRTPDFTHRRNPANQIQRESPQQFMVGGRGRRLDSLAVPLCLE